MVKGEYRADAPDVTYEDAFTSFFATPRWKYFESEDGQDVVEFTGDCTYQDVPVKARIQFVVDEENGIFGTTMPYSIRTEDSVGGGTTEYFYWGNEDTYAFRREDTGTNALPGDWKPNPNLIAGDMTLFEDGTGLRGNRYFSWYADDTTYTEIQTQGRIYGYSVSEDTLILFFSDGVEMFSNAGS